MPPRADPSFPAFRGRTLYWGGAIGLGVLLLYIHTAARDIVVGDTPELMTVAVTLGVAHPSGYPLLTLLGHAFNLLPLGPVAFRVNLLAAVCGAATVGLVYATAWRLSRCELGAAVAALALALHPLFWSWSLVFEAFSLNNLVAGTLIGLLVLWEARPQRHGYLVAAAFVGGLGLANHQTIVLLGPATLFLVWLRRNRLLQSPRLLGKCVAALALGLLPYAYIPWAAARHPFLSWGNAVSLPNFVALVLRTDYGTGNLVAATEFQGGSPIARLLALAMSFSMVEVPLLIAGAVEAYRHTRSVFWFALLGFCFAGPAFVAYANMDLTKDSALWVLQRFFLLPHVVAAPLVASGVAWVIRWASAAATGRARLVSTAVGLSALTALVVPAARAYRHINQRDNHIAGRYARDLLDTLEPGSLLLASGDEHGSPVAFVQAVEGRRPDVTLVLTPLLKGAWYVEHMRARYPDLQIPTDKAPALLTLRDIVDANQQRPIAVVGALIDKSLEGKYGFIQHGLVSLVKPATQVFDLVRIAANTDILLQRYQPPLPTAIHRETFEPQILRSYASPAEWVGEQYQKAGHPADAVKWYERALRIDPDYPEAQKGLAQVAGK